MQQEEKLKVAQFIVKKGQAGVTLVEACVALAVLAVIAGTTAPSFGASLIRHKVEGLADQVRTDIHYTRSSAVAGNRPLRMSFTNSDAGSCYVIHTGEAGQCVCAGDGAAQCETGAQALKAVFVPSGTAVQLQSNVPSIVFDPEHGTATPTGTIKVVGERVGAIHDIVNVMGRVRSCSPLPALPGHKPC